MIRDFLSNLSISAIYLISDITVFNKNLNGELNFLPASEDNILLESIRLGEWDTFLRTIYTETTREPEMQYLGVKYSAPDEEDICFEVKKPFDEYRLDSISQNLKEIQWPLKMKD